MESITRRYFVRSTPWCVAAWAAPSFVLGQAAPPSQVAAQQNNERPAPLPADRVKEFVIAGHGNLPKVQTMLESDPGLLNAAWDWGAGDFEMAIGGAGHMGRVDIAEYLLSNGARMDIFVAAMLGKLDIVRATLAAYPALKHSLGPHGISLLRHAEVGKERAAEVLAFLKQLGVK